MPIFPRLRLIAALLLAVLQLARVGAEWLDAAHSASSQPVVMHVESLGGSSHCPPAHDLDCAICVGLSTPALPSHATDAPLAVVVRSQSTAASYVPALTGTAGYPYDSRAPPVG